MKFLRLIYAIQILSLVSGRSLDSNNSRSNMNVLDHNSARLSKQMLHQKILQNDLVNRLRSEMNSRYGFQISNTKLSRTLVYWMRAILWIKIWIQYISESISWNDSNLNTEIDIIFICSARHRICHWVCFEIAYKMILIAIKVACLAEQNLHDGDREADRVPIFEVRVENNPGKVGAIHPLLLLTFLILIHYCIM